MESVTALALAYLMAFARKADISALSGPVSGLPTITALSRSMLSITALTRLVAASASCAAGPVSGLGASMPTLTACS